MCKAMEKLTPMWLQLSLAFAIQMFLETINMFIIGKLDDTVALAAVGLGNIILIMFIMSLLLGMNTALETLVSQAHGAGHLKLGGEYLNRMRIILTLMFIPLCICLSFAEPFLLALGQDQEVVEIAAKYLMLQLPGMFMFALFDANRLFLNAMEVTQIATLILAVGLPFHILMANYFVFGLGLGVNGLAYAIDISYTAFFVMITLYSHFTTNEQIREAWFLPGRESFKEWRLIINLGIPGCFMYFVDWSSFEVIALMAGAVGVADQATIEVILVAAPLLTCFAFGM